MAVSNMAKVIQAAIPEHSLKPQQVWLTSTLSDGEVNPSFWIGSAPTAKLIN